MSFTLLFSTVVHLHRIVGKAKRSLSLKEYRTEGKLSGLIQRNTLERHCEHSLYPKAVLFLTVTHALKVLLCKI